ncbi:GNAT family N-acetyltransferase [Crocinitomix algicola]|uniref:GNAT family N-acetyltransferase n=1 Tax=Crocinitomix algicola TaxID=1740263 RepID=UPI0008726D32|nr:GNAT family N-acetyltransferase [Crocinitomix algicola]
MDNKLTHNKFDRHFELCLNNNEKAYVSYTKSGNHLNLVHSEVPSHLRGQGIGRELVLKTFDAIRNEKLTATAHCSYIRAVRQRNPLYADVISL